MKKQQHRSINFWSYSVTKLFSIFSYYTYYICALFFCAFLLSSCSDWRSYNRPQGKNQTIKEKYASTAAGSYKGSSYQVQKGDTLYFISYITGEDVNNLIRYNNLKEPYSLYVGQKISLINSSNIKTESPVITALPSTIVNSTVKTTTGVAAPTVISTTKTDPYASTISENEKTLNNAMQNAKKSTSTSKNTMSTVTSQSKKTAVDSENKIKIPATAVAKNTTKYDPVMEGKLRESGSVSSWKWPTKGSILTRFSSGDLGSKGIDIGGSKGQSIYAAADGKVVHSGNALRGYGNLIIIKHNQDYLSAYAHNDTLLVKEGDYVKVGQKIATMGNSGATRVQLHFEIRYKGKSVNPERYLP